jgi:hypothetical protein
MQEYRLVDENAKFRKLHCPRRVYNWLIQDEVWRCRGTKIAMHLELLIK